MTRNAARTLARTLNNTMPKAVTTTDPLALELMRKLERRGIGKYLPDEQPDPEEERRQALRDLAEWNRNLPQWQADREAERAAGDEANRARSMTTAQLFQEALRKSAETSDGSGASGRSHMPLNGASVLVAALGGSGTVNGA